MWSNKQRLPTMKVRIASLAFVSNPQQLLMTSEFFRTIRQKYTSSRTNISLSGHGARLVQLASQPSASSCITPCAASRLMLRYRRRLQRSSLTELLAPTQRKMIATRAPSSQSLSHLSPSSFSSGAYCGTFGRDERTKLKRDPTQLIHLPNLTSSPSKTLKISQTMALVTNLWSKHLILNLPVI